MLAENWISGANVLTSFSVELLCYMEIKHSNWLKLVTMTSNIQSEYLNTV